MPLRASVLVGAIGVSGLGEEDQRAVEAAVARLSRRSTVLDLTAWPRKSCSG
jgi:uncharacterized protein GlcG (DUF336 family)